MTGRGSEMDVAGGAGIMGGGMPAERMMDMENTNVEKVSPSHVEWNENGGNDRNHGDLGESGGRVVFTNDEEKSPNSRKIEDEGKGASVENETSDGDQLSCVYDEYYDEDDLEILQKQSEFRADIRALYLAGVPLFTRQALQELSLSFKQLQEKPERGKKRFTHVKSLNGVMVAFEIKTGRKFPFGPKRELLFGKPMIYYRSIQGLLSSEHPSAPREAYCSIQLGYETVLHDAITKAIICDKQPGPSKPSMEDTLHIFNTNRNRWDHSEERRMLTSLIRSIDTLNGVKQIVAFACGTMQDNCERQSSSSAHQHALILTLRDALLARVPKPDEVEEKACLRRREEQPDRGTEIPCYAQDPAYSDADKAILRDNGITVLDDPDGFITTDEATLVLSFSPNVPVKQITMDIVRPAAMIWNRVKEERDDGIVCTDPDSSRIKGLIDTFYSAFEFPGAQEHFGDVVLYVKCLA